MGDGVRVRLPSLIAVAALSVGARVGSAGVSELQVQASVKVIKKTIEVA